MSMYYDSSIFEIKESFENKILKRVSTNVSGSIVIPDGVTTIGFSAFNYCKQVTQIIIPESVTEIKSRAFEGCEKLISLNIPSKVALIPEDALTYGCNSLQSIDVSLNNNYLYSVDGVLFSKEDNTLLVFPAAKSTLSYSIPAGIRKINDHAFSGAKNVKEVIIPSSVTEIGGWAFSNSDIQSLKIQSALQVVGDCAFNRMKKIENFSVSSYNGILNVVDGVLFAIDKITGAKKLIAYPGNKKDSVYQIPAGTLTIEQGAFSGNNYITKVVLPSGISRIEAGVFWGTPNIEEVNIPSSVKYVSSTVFYFCSKLRKLIIDVKLPGGVFEYDKEYDDGERFFKDVDKSLCTLFVPSGTSSIYRTSPIFKFFRKIIEQ